MADTGFAGDRAKSHGVFQKTAYEMADKSNEALLAGFLGELALFFASGFTNLGQGAGY
jgi:hypothetical protein